MSRGQQLAAKLVAAAAGEGAGKGKKAVPPPRVEVLELDLSSLDSVRAFAASWNARGEALVCLVNNAGIFDMAATMPEVGPSGHEAHWLTNFVAPSLLALLLLPSLRRCPASRVVNVSSIMHTVGTLHLSDPSFSRRRFTATAAYGQSKLAAVAFTAELERRLQAAGCSGVRCMSVHPGNVITGVVRTLPRLVQAAYRLVLGRILLTPEEGARSTVFCAAAAAAVQAPGPGPYFDSTCRLAVPHPDADSPELGAAVWKYLLDTCHLDEAAVLRDGARVANE
jgi:NAD(P)-dependent dehydrogenase (short-subunit alcohol dehydrogenase family)